MVKKCAFLDRDGTLIFEPQDDFQIDSIEKLKILDGVIEGLKSLIDSGYSLVMVSNQNGIGTDSFPKEDFEKPQARMLEIFEENGIVFDEIFICPHFASDNCDCRKPKTKLVDGFMDDVDLENSFMCGDRDTDREFGENLGIAYVPMECNGVFPRIADLERKTSETDIKIFLNLDGSGKYEIDTGIGFLDHMLELFSKHSLIDLKVKCDGDLKVDEHHSVEDVGIVLGQAINTALTSRIGVERYGFLLPMDESLAEVAVDLGGRSYLVWNAEFKREMIGDMPTELFEEFFRAVADNLKANIHVNLRYGKNEHHMIEGIFKAFARALKMAISRDERAKNLLASTKGRL